VTLACSSSASVLFGCAWIDSALLTDSTLKRNGSFPLNLSAIGSVRAHRFWCTQSESGTVLPGWVGAVGGGWWRPRWVTDVRCGRGAWLQFAHEVCAVCALGVLQRGGRDGGGDGSWWWWQWQWWWQRVQLVQGSECAWMETTAPSARQMSDGTLWCVPIHSSAYGDAGSTTNAGLPDAANCRRERECSVSVMLCQSAHDGMWVRVVRAVCGNKNEKSKLLFTSDLQTEPHSKQHDGKTNLSNSRICADLAPFVLLHLAPQAVCSCVGLGGCGMQCKSAKECVMKCLRS
jgi:hypothetical protein